MINALRTLLLNQPGSNSPGSGYPGEEYVDPLYAARPLSGALKTVYQLVFGINPDRAYLNWRLREILPILHSTPMVDAVTDLDPRITYLPFDSRFYNLLAAGPVVTPQGVTTAQLYPSLAPNPTEQLYYSWLLTVADGTHLTVAPLTPSQPAFNVTYATAGGLGGPVHLQNSPVSVSFQPTVGASWMLTVLAPPTRNLMDVYWDLKHGVGSDLGAQLFGNPPVEPYLSFKNVWELSPYPSWQLCGPVLALAYGINALVV